MLQMKQKTKLLQVYLMSHLLSKLSRIFTPLQICQYLKNNKK